LGGDQMILMAGFAGARSGAAASCHTIRSWADLAAGSCGPRRGDLYGAGSSGSLRQLGAFERRLTAANEPVENAVRVLRSQLGLPHPDTS
jgi:hypothetical protein